MASLDYEVDIAKGGRPKAKADRAIFLEPSAKRADFDDTMNEVFNLGHIWRSSCHRKLSG